MSKVLFRESTLQDCAALFGHLREEDLGELRATGVSSYGALREGYERGEECYTAIYTPTNEVMAMFGAAPETVAGNRAVVWLLGSRRIDECKFEYLHFGKKFLKYMLLRYSLIFNYVDARSKKSVRLLKLLGFHFVPARDIRLTDTVFQYFEMEA